MEGRKSNLGNSPGRKTCSRQRKFPRLGFPDERFSSSFPDKIGLFNHFSVSTAYTPMMSFTRSNTVGIVTTAIPMKSMITPDLIIFVMGM